MLCCIIVSKTKGCHGFSACARILLVEILQSQVTSIACATVLSPIQVHGIAATASKRNQPAACQAIDSFTDVSSTPTISDQIVGTSGVWMQSNLCPNCSRTCEGTRWVIVTAFCSRACEVFLHLNQKEPRGRDAKIKLHNTNFIKGCVQCSLPCLLFPTFREVATTLASCYFSWIYCKVATLISITSERKNNLAGTDNLACFLGMHRTDPADWNWKHLFHSAIYLLPKPVRKVTTMSSKKYLARPTRQAGSRTSLRPSEIQLRPSSLPKKEVAWSHARWNLRTSCTSMIRKANPRNGSSSGSTWKASMKGTRNASGFNTAKLLLLCFRLQFVDAQCTPMHTNAHIVALWHCKKKVTWAFWIMYMYNILASTASVSTNTNAGASHTSRIGPSGWRMGNAQQDDIEGLAQRGSKQVSIVRKRRCSVQLNIWHSGDHIPPFNAASPRSRFSILPGALQGNLRWGFYNCFTTATPWASGSS